MRLDYLAKHYGGKLLTLIKDLGNGEGAVNVKIAGTEDTGTGALGVNLKESQVIQPVDIQARLTHLVQTHSGVNILPNSWGSSPWIDSHVNGSPMTYLGVSVNMSSGSGMTVKVSQSHNGVDFFSESTLSEAGLHYGTDKDIQLSARYFRVDIKNKDTVNPKVTNAYAYLKV
jgi:hypothetical protein